jgi:hypothetical protein
VKPKTAILARQLAATKDLFERIEILKDAYRGETLFVAACGPSLSRIPLPALQEFLAGKLVLSIKQAYRKLPQQTDFHVIHHSNLERYRYPRDHAPIVVNEDEGHSFLHADLVLPKVASNLYASLSVFRNFDDYLLERNPVRPCGPGVMYEMVFYLAVHLGVRRIVALGWDLYSDPEQLRQLAQGFVGQTHFYETDWRRFDEDRRQAAGMGLEETLERFRAGQMINHHGRIDPEDIIFTALATRPFAGWLRRQGVQLFVVSDSPNISRTIPRVDLARAGDDAYLDSVAAEYAGVRAAIPEYPHFQVLRQPSAHVSPGDSRLVVGWHPLEHWDGVPTRWSGPRPSSYLLLPVFRDRDLRVRLECIAAPPGELPEVYADGNPLPLAWSREAGLFRGEGLLRAGEAWDEVYTLFEFRMARLFQPASEMAGSTDARRLGFAFRSFRLDPEGG